MAKQQRPTRREHDIVIEFVAQILPHFQAEFEQVVQRSLAVVGAHDGGVAPGIAAADPAFFQDRNVAQTVNLREIIGGRESVAATADDQHVVGRLRVGIAPRRLPMPMPGQGPA